MSVISRASSSRGVRPQLGRFGVVLVVAAAILGTMTVGFAGAITTGLIYACVNNSSGTIKVVSATTTCASNEIMLVWNGEGSQGPTGPTGPTGATGPTGPAGTFSGTFTSPNGECSISVTDTGIVIGGANCPLRVNASTINSRSTTTTRIESGTTTTIEGAAGTTVDSGAVTTVRGAALANINGGLVNLNGGCLPVARFGDPVVAPAGVGIITNGSPVVRAC